MARSMFSPGMLTALAASIAVRRRGLPPGSPPPLRAATVISRITLVQDEARLASVIAFFRLICFHLLWPAMSRTPSKRRVGDCGKRCGWGNISGAPACGNEFTPLVSPLYAQNTTPHLGRMPGAAGLRVRVAQAKASRLSRRFLHPSPSAESGAGLPGGGSGGAAAHHSLAGR